MRLIATLSLLLAITPAIGGGTRVITSDPKYGASKTDACKDAIESVTNRPRVLSIPPINVISADCKCEEVDFGKVLGKAPKCIAIVIVAD